MSNPLHNSNRPSSITLISVFAVLGGLLSFYFILQGGFQNLGFGNILFFTLGGIVFLACGVGFWLMKKWAVYAYAIFGILDQTILLLIGRWSIMSLVIPVIVVFIGYRNLSKMS